MRSVNSHGSAKARPSVSIETSTSSASVSAAASDGKCLSPMHEQHKIEELRGLTSPELVFTFHDLDAGKPRELFVYLYIKSVYDIDEVKQSFRTAFFQYLTWVPTIEEYRGMLEDPNGYTPAYQPRLKPSNGRRDSQVELEVPRMMESNPIHILVQGSHDAFGARTFLPKGTVLFGLLRRYEFDIVSSFALKSFPYDHQSLNIFFDAIENTDFVKIHPSNLYQGKPLGERDCLALGTNPTNLSYPFALLISTTHHTNLYYYYS